MGDRMGRTFTVLLLAPSDGSHVRELVDQLSNSGAMVKMSRTAAEFEQALCEDPLLSIAVIDSAVGRELGEALLHTCHALQPRMPKVWATNDTLSGAPTSFIDMPDAIIEYGISAEELMGTMQRLLQYSRYPDALVGIVDTCVRTTIADSLRLHLDGAKMHITANVNEMSSNGALLSFCGPAVSGTVAICAEDELLAEMGPYNGVDETFGEELSDLAGELANIVLGRMKHELADRGMKILLGTPTACCAANRQTLLSGPALVFAFEADGYRFRVKLLIRGIDRDRLDGPLQGRQAVCDPGELILF